MNISLRIVNNSDIEFLYRLLEEREPNVNISHKKMPTYANHKKFVSSKPYSKWYIINDNKERIGSIYLSKQNEIGIFITKEYRKNGVGMKAMNLLMKMNPRERYLANVNPKNSKSAKFFRKNGFRLIQYTYELNMKK